MDIEGHEYKALLGMKKILKYDNPVIYIELAETNISSRKKIANFLSENGYKFSYYFFHEDRFMVKGYLIELSVFITGLTVFLIRSFVFLIGSSVFLIVSSVFFWGSV